MLEPRLIQANTTLLQPASQFFRISDLIAYNVRTAASEAIAGHVAAAAAAATLASLQTQLTALQTQIDSLHARLAAAGIA